MDIRHRFARNLRAAREAKDISQEHLAHEAKLHRTYISLLERGRYYASLKAIEKIAKVLEIDPADLLRKDENSSGSE
ncbi:XRE family transcriptional regulator [Mesorhizobium sp. M1A.F.Ca.ET.072.01.1.1]|uniref:helix-turn-helix domain-containing protein n=1 Tax=Mesorhizobium sp. M1A.F.Ca.ET.072.01.1.1 TaxID=2496753 RepID=UPI000FD4B999|nr:helix-turn-helix transcriptional regulator [Mesorhizobium sp. M1A.F.Ca.ET.072.01.1.1]RUW55441.1 XRE family transcriptional regulator [Mesorhizobium sp. M1A.F.Ca.ET.072.01.1.1]TIV03742.1 MAG: helix-turn-helix domain-containing protein [Mesorhizobium sp.]